MGLKSEPPYSVHFANSHYIDLAMPEDTLSHKLKDACDHFSYLAKVETKPRDGKRVYGCSDFNNAGWSLLTQKIKRKGA